MARGTAFTLDRRPRQWWVSSQGGCATGSTRSASVRNRGHGSCALGRESLMTSSRQPTHRTLYQPGWLEERLRAGRSLASVAAEVGCSVAAVRRVAVRLDVPRRLRRAPVPAAARPGMALSPLHRAGLLLGGHRGRGGLQLELGAACFADGRGTDPVRSRPTPISGSVRRASGAAPLRAQVRHDSRHRREARLLEDVGREGLAALRDTGAWGPVLPPAEEPGLAAACIRHRRRDR